MSKNNTYMNKTKHLHLTSNGSPFWSKDYKVKGCHTHKIQNELIVFRHTKKKLYTYKHSITNVQVTEGKITFFVEDGSPIIFENKNLVRDVCTEGDPPSPNKYDSFWGKKSILEHHSSQIWHMATCYGAIGDESSMCLMSELLHNGVTQFILEDYEQSKESLERFYMNA